MLNSNTHAPLISIIVPYYNSEMFLERTIQSIQNQTYINWELLVVDDGSSDNGSDLVGKMLKEDKRIFSLKRPDVGYKSGGRGAKNYGFTKGKGFYTVFFDADDYMLSNYLEERIKKFQDEENVDVVFSNFGWKTESNLIPKKIYTYHPNFNNEFSNINKTVDFWKSYTDLNFFWVPSNMMWKSSSIKKLKWNEDTTIGEDFEFNTQAIIENLNFAHINENTWYYMRNENSMMATSENPLQIEKRSLFMSIVLDKLIKADYIKEKDDLIEHFLKDQYRFLRRVLATRNSVKDKWISVKVIILRIKKMINYIENKTIKFNWKNKRLKSYPIIFAVLFFKRGHKLFDIFLIGRRTKNKVLSSRIIKNSNSL